MKGRKWDIFISAVSMFAELGFENISMKDIAARNCIQAPAIYNHFKSKDDLLETMYHFYHTNWKQCHPTLDDALSLIPDGGVDAVFKVLAYQYSEEIQPIMDRIVLTASRTSGSDERAFRLIKYHLFDAPGNFLKTVFNEMISHNMVKPFDVDSYVIIFTNLAYSASVRNSTPEAININEWMGINRLLNSLIVPVG